MIETTSEDRLKEIIGGAMGYASMCWDPQPEGTFDSIKAGDHLGQVMLNMRSEIQKLERENAALRKAARELVRKFPTKFAVNARNFHLEQGAYWPVRELRLLAPPEALEGVSLDW